MDTKIGIRGMMIEMDGCEEVAGEEEMYVSSNIIIKRHSKISQSVVMFVLLLKWGTAESS